MGVVVRKGSPGAAKILKDLQPYTTSKLLATMENNRIALYTRVLQMQYEAVAHAEEADRLAETVAAQRHEIERLREHLNRAKAEVAALRHELEERPLPRPETPPGLNAVLTELGRAAAAQIRKTRH
jgi:predicted  nucleic acid-binding Zn-ribbon protein